MVQAVRHRPLAAEAQAQSQGSPCKIYGVKTGTRAGFCPENFGIVLYHSTSDPYS